MFEFVLFFFAVVYFFLHMNCFGDLFCFVQIIVNKLSAEIHKEYCAFRQFRINLLLNNLNILYSKANNKHFKGHSTQKWHPFLLPNDLIISVLINQSKPLITVYLSHWWMINDHYFLINILNMLNRVRYHMSWTQTRLLTHVKG